MCSFMWGKFQVEEIQNALSAITNNLFLKCISETHGAFLSFHLYSVDVFWGLWPLTYFFVYISERNRNTGSVVALIIYSNILLGRKYIVVILNDQSLYQNGLTLHFRFWSISSLKPLGCTHLSLRWCRCAFWGLSPLTYLLTYVSDWNDDINTEPFVALIIFFGVDKILYKFSMLRINCVLEHFLLQDWSIRTIRS